MAAGNDKTSTSEVDIAAAVYRQAMSNWIEPEVRLRHKRDGIELPMHVYQAQIIFGLDGSHVVRLNTEVKGELKARINRPVKKGQLIYNKDVDQIVFSQLSSEDEGYGHITMISHGSGSDTTTWSVSFSFIYGPKRVTEYLDMGKDFLSQAEVSLAQSYRVGIALGMTAAENLIKARISASPRGTLNGRTHGGLMSQFAKFIKDDPLKSIDQKYVDAYKFFKKHFNAVRYDPSHAKVNRNTIKMHLRSLRRLENETTTIITKLPNKSLADRQIKL